MVDTRKPESKPDENRATTIEPSSTWMNLTRSKKGFIIHVKDDFKKGDILLGGMSALTEFVEGKRNGINLGMLVEVED